LVGISGLAPLYPFQTGGRRDRFPLAPPRCLRQRIGRCRIYDATPPWLLQG